jgi:nucleoside-diphosphate-sugar epimerase
MEVSTDPQAEAAHATAAAGQPVRSGRGGNVTLLTGASGVVGAAIMPRLASGTVVALTHRDGVDGSSVRGDITQPWLGLDRDSYRTLAHAVDAIVHCAGVTEFDADATTMYDRNVRGTEQVVRFAIDAGARLVFSSTAFVARVDAVRDAPTGGRISPVAYLESKLAAEQVVRAAEVPAAIARLSVVIGDAATGEMNRFQGMHSTMLAVMRSLLPVMPFAPDAAVDLLPRDLVAQALLALARAPLSQPAATYWITAGERAPTMRHIVTLGVARARELGLSARTPRFVPADLVDRVTRSVYGDSPVSRRRFDNLMALASLFEPDVRFPSSLGALPDGPAAPTPALLDAAFRNSIDYLGRAKGLTA